VPTSADLYASARENDAEAQQVEEASALGAGFLDRLSDLGNFVLTTWTEKHTEEVWTSAAAAESREALGRLWTRLLGAGADLQDEKRAWSTRAAGLREDARILRRGARWAAEAEEQERRREAEQAEELAGATGQGRWS
jgi:hypothetical protein